MIILIKSKNIISTILCFNYNIVDITNYDGIYALKSASKS